LRDRSIPSLFYIPWYDTFKVVFSQVSYPITERVHNSKQVHTLTKLKIRPLKMSCDLGSGLPIIIITVVLKD
jgi:hypothetical protein